ncbi:MAG: alpha/beta fold hydrolase [Bifidobacteriaceae bacterium]|jgi:triacylglycerol esterase/lipase EstA (alpha/beta hydrolase family)|nr:alpha/beta fold hydrolase [Bifidobacteriaceae bacterium]
MSRNKFIAAALAAVLALGAASAAATAASAAPKEDPKPWALRSPKPGEDTNLPAALLGSVANPYRVPVGANNWSCRPSAAHPEPVILIHGTWVNQYSSWAGLSPILQAQGYCVFVFNYGATMPAAALGLLATGDMVQSASEVAAFVQVVRQATGAEHVALIGYSQGGSQARYYANLNAPAGEVTKVIGIAPSNHPTTLSGIVTLGNVLGLTNLGFAILTLVGMPGAAQQAQANSPFYVNLNGRGETVPGVAYTNIVTKYDEVVTPYTQGKIKAGKGATVNNIVLQDACKLDLSEHVSAPYSKNVAQLVLNALDPDHPHKIKCYAQAPIIGSTL